MYDVVALPQAWSLPANCTADPVTVPSQGTFVTLEIAWSLQRLASTSVISKAPLDPVKRSLPVLALINGFPGIVLQIVIPCCSTTSWLETYEIVKPLPKLSLTSRSAVSEVRDCCGAKKARTNNRSLEDRRSMAAYDTDTWKGMRW